MALWPLGVYTDFVLFFCFQDYLFIKYFDYASIWCEIFIFRHKDIRGQKLNLAHQLVPLFLLKNYLPFGDHWCPLVKWLGKNTN